VTQLRNPFNVLSGASDVFSSVKVSKYSTFDADPNNFYQEICAGVPDIDEGMLPVFRYSPDIELNRYILDFYEHEQLNLLEKANMLLAGDSYELTNTFRLSLRAIASILVEITNETDPLRKFIVELSLEYGSRMKTEHQKRALIPK